MHASLIQINTGVISIHASLIQILTSVRFLVMYSSTYLCEVADNVQKYLPLCEAVGNVQ